MVQQLSYQERVMIGERAMAGESDAQIAMALGCSRWAVRKWRRRFKKHGRAGLVSTIGRPARGALGSYSVALRDRIEQIRLEHPGWGAASILDQLAHAEQMPQLPSRARVAAFLKEKGLTRRYERYSGVVRLPPRVAIEAHDEWEADAQGPEKVDGLGQVWVINITDVISHLKVASCPFLDKHLSWLSYQLTLRGAFVEFGLPVRISFDHDSVVYDNTCTSPFPARLHLWLTALGVEVVFINRPPPLNHAIIERTHQTMNAQALYGQHWDSQPALWYALDERRQALNQRLPCRSLDGCPPLLVHPEAARTQRPYRIEWEPELLDLTRVYTLLATGRWFRQTSSHGEFCLALHRYNMGRPMAKSTIEITFDPTTCEFIAHLPTPSACKRFPALGLTKADLMGDLTTISLPNYQYALPFTLEQWRILELATRIGGTT